MINNAGVVITSDFGDLTVDELDKCLAVHVRGSFLVSKAAWTYMAKASYGRILNVCSVDGVLFGNKRHAPTMPRRAGCRPTAVTWEFRSTAGSRAR